MGQQKLCFELVRQKRSPSTIVFSVICRLPHILVLPMTSPENLFSTIFRYPMGQCIFPGPFSFIIINKTQYTNNSLFKWRWTLLNYLNWFELAIIHKKNIFPLWCQFWGLGCVGGGDLPPTFFSQKVTFHPTTSKIPAFGLHFGRFSCGGIPLDPPSPTPGLKLNWGHCSTTQKHALVRPDFFYFVFLRHFRSLPDVSIKKKWK